MKFHHQSDTEAGAVPFDSSAAARRSPVANPPTNDRQRQHQHESDEDVENVAANANDVEHAVGACAAVATTANDDADDSLDEHFRTALSFSDNDDDDDTAVDDTTPNTEYSFGTDKGDEHSLYAETSFICWPNKQSIDPATWAPIESAQPQMHTPRSYLLGKRQAMQRKAKKLLCSTPMVPIPGTSANQQLQQPMDDYDGEQSTSMAAPPPPPPVRAVMAEMVETPRRPRQPPAALNKQPAALPSFEIRGLQQLAWLDRMIEKQRKRGRSSADSRHMRAPMQASRPLTDAERAMLNERYGPLMNGSNKPVEGRRRGMRV